MRRIHCELEANYSVKFTNHDYFINLINSNFMSRIGKQPITIPAGVTVDITKNAITVKGSKGTLDFNILE